MMPGSAVLQTRYVFKKNKKSHPLLVWYFVCMTFSLNLKVELWDFF